MRAQNPCFLLVFAFVLSTHSYGQDEDLLKQLGADSVKKEYVYNAFKSSRVIMSHSMEMLRPGVLDFRILHRFGKINGGLYEFFGLDGPANIRLGLDYGIMNNLTMGIGRSTYNKELDGFIKYRLIQQSTGPRSMPFSFVLIPGITYRTAKWTDGINHYATDRLSYYAQAIIGRKFTEAFTLQLSPIMVHRNLTETTADANDLFAGGIGGRIKISKRVSINADYFYVINQDANKNLKNPLSIGFDIETGGHVFQLHLTNAMGMNERAFISETTSDWGKGDIEVGFNISRAFQLKKKKS
ncbi:MAG: DUF5777 family beta-barrel protein [Candidatus Dadabacteria bacterium]